MKKLLLLLLLIPSLAFGQSTGKIMSNRATNATLSVDTINANSILNLHQTTAGVTITIPNKTTFVSSGSSTKIHNTGTVSVTISPGTSIAAGTGIILDWVGNSWNVIGSGSGGAGAFLPLAGGTANDSSGKKSISTVTRGLFDSGENISVDYENQLLKRPSFTTIDWFHEWLIGSPGVVFDWENGFLSYINTINDASNVLSVDISSRALSGEWAINGGNFKLNFNDLAYVNGIRDNSNVLSVGLHSRTLNSTGGSVVLDWINAWWKDNAGVKFLDGGNRMLYKSSGAATLDFDNSILKGRWSTDDTLDIGNNANAFLGKIYSDNLSANRTYQLPDSSGILVVSFFSTATLDFPSTAAGASSDLTISVTGAADGDPVAVGVPKISTLSNGSFTAWVSALDTVKVRFSNNSAGALDPPSGIFKVTVFK